MDTLEKEKCAYIRDRVSGSGSSRELIKTYNNLLGKAEKTSFPNNILEENLPTEFNDYFVNKVDRMRDDLDRLPSDPTFEEQPCSESLTHFKAVSEDEVNNIILKSPKKMCQPDPLPVNLFVHYQQ